MDKLRIYGKSVIEKYDECCFEFTIDAPGSADIFYKFAVTLGLLLRYCILLRKKNTITEGLKLCVKLWKILPDDDRNHVVFYETKLRFLLKFIIVNILIAGSIYLALPYLIQFFC